MARPRENNRRRCTSQNRERWVDIRAGSTPSHGGGYRGLPRAMLPINTAAERLCPRDRMGGLRLATPKDPRQRDSEDQGADDNQRREVPRETRPRGASGRIVTRGPVFEGSAAYAHESAADFAARSTSALVIFGCPVATVVEHAIHACTPGCLVDVSWMCDCRRRVRPGERSQSKRRKRSHGQSAAQLSFVSGPSHVPSPQHMAVCPAAQADDAPPAVSCETMSPWKQPMNMFSPAPAEW